MIIEKSIIINELNYYIGIELKYGDNKSLQKKDGSYFDCGDLTYLVESIETNFEKNCDYDKDIPYMNDIIYIYDRIPFLSYIKKISYNRVNQIENVDIIYKEEIDNYINKNNIVVGKFNGKESVCPMLFQ